MKQEIKGKCKSNDWSVCITEFQKVRVSAPCSYQGTSGMTIFRLSTAVCASKLPSSACFLQVSPSSHISWSPFVMMMMMINLQVVTEEWQWHQNHSWFEAHNQWGQGPRGSVSPWKFHLLAFITTSLSGVYPLASPTISCQKRKYGKDLQDMQDHNRHSDPKFCVCIVAPYRKLYHWHWPTNPYCWQNEEKAGRSSKGNCGATRILLHSQSRRRAVSIRMSMISSLLSEGGSLLPKLLGGYP